MTDLPASALDEAGGGSCDADARRRGRSRRRLLERAGRRGRESGPIEERPYASEGDGAISDLLQIELGGEGTTVKVDNLAEPIVFDIPCLDYDPTLEAGYDPGIRTGTCWVIGPRSLRLRRNLRLRGVSRSDTPDGSTMNATPANLPLEITASCPAKAAAAVLGQRDEKLVF